jgi:hypothetical protein
MMELMILAAMGALLHLLFKWNNARKRHQALFNWPAHLRTTIIGLLSVWLLIYVRDDLRPIIEINRITAIFLGYIGDSALKNLVKTFKGKLTNWD